jgi:YVTN family beta-propeller protein
MIGLSGFMISAFQKIGGLRSGRLRRLAAVFLLGALEIACNENYRPVVQPVLPPPPNPAANHYVISLTTNGYDVLNQVTGLCSPSGLLPPCVGDPGSASRIDVSGDTYSGVFNTGVAPVHAALTANGSKLYVANSGEDTVSVNNVSSPTVVGTISMPAGAQPVFVHSAETGNMYVANYGNNTISQVNTTSDVVVGSVSLGGQPVALAEMPNAQKLYVAQQGPGAVTSINITGLSVATTIPLAGSIPVWAVARSDNANIYVLDNSGTIYEIATLSDTPTAISTSMGAGANYMALDPKLQRLYVTNPSNGRVGIFDTSGTLNQLAVIDLSQGAGAPCPSGCSPVSVTGIGDGSRVYVASYELTSCSGSPCVSTQVEVINTGNNAVSKVIPISMVAVDMKNATGCGPATGPPATTPWTPGTARFRAFAASSGGGSTTNFKVYVSQCDAGSVAVIDASASAGSSPHPADVYTVALRAPLSSFPPQQASISGATEDPSKTFTTYNYTLTSGSGLKVGMKIFVTGMSDSGNNGYFPISSLGAGTFTVANSSGVTTSGQGGSGTVMPPQNPVFVVAGP